MHAFQGLAVVCQARLPTARTEFWSIFEIQSYDEFANMLQIFNAPHALPGTILTFLLHFGHDSYDVGSDSDLDSEGLMKLRIRETLHVALCQLPSQPQEMQRFAFSDWLTMNPVLIDPFEEASLLRNQRLSICQFEVTMVPNEPVLLQLSQRFSSIHSLHFISRLYDHQPARRIFQPIDHLELKSLAVTM